MGIQVADNFDHKSKKPLDARISYTTLALMKAVTDTNIYEGCEAYCAETDKYYKFLSTNTVDASTGKWRERATGGGGSSYTAGTGIDITNDVISTKQSQSGDIDEIVDVLPDGGRVAVTGYVPLGTVIPVYRETAPQFFLICDGSTYNKADYPELAELLLGLTTHSQYEVDGDATKFKVPDLRGEFIRGTGANSHSNQGSGSSVGIHQNATEHVRIIGNNSSGQVQVQTDTGTGSWSYPQNIESTRNYGTHYWINVSGSKGSDSNYTYYTARPTNTSVLYIIKY